MSSEDDDKSLAEEELKQREALGVELKAEFDPGTAIECEIVQRACSVLWSLRRASLFESATIEAYLVERVQTEPDRVSRYNQVYGKIYFEEYFKRNPQFAPPPDACIEEQELELPPGKATPSEDKRNANPDFSFLNDFGILNSLTRHARYERLLVHELSGTLSELRRKPAKAKRSSTTSKKNKAAETAKRILISGEDCHQFQALRTGILRQDVPKTALEWELVEQIVALTWRLRRGAGFAVPLMASARRAFKPPQNYADDLDRLIGRVVRNPEGIAEEAVVVWEPIRADKKQLAAEIAEALGDEPQAILSELWFIRERDIQEKLEKLARYQAALTRQLAAIRKLLRSLQSNAIDEKNAKGSLAALATPG